MKLDLFIILDGAPIAYAGKEGKPLCRIEWLAIIEIMSSAVMRELYEAIISFSKAYTYFDRRCWGWKKYCRRGVDTL